MTKDGSIPIGDEQDSPQMDELSKKEIERQDFVDNEIWKLIRRLKPDEGKVEFKWDIEAISKVRITIQDAYTYLGYSESAFYPYTEEEREDLA